MVTGHDWASLSSKELMDKIISQSHRAKFRKYAVRNNFQEKLCLEECTSHISVILVETHPYNPSVSHHSSHQK